jgi:putative methionine-R-sulfoxide reductase with GAF domain
MRPIPESAGSGERVHEAAVGACEDAVARLVDALESVEVTCLLRRGDVLRLVAHAGPLRVIYEIPRDFGGVAWRSLELLETVLVPDVRADEDYIAVDDVVVSEIAAPIVVGGEAVGVLNAETWERPFGRREADAVAAEAVALAQAFGR